MHSITFALSNYQALKNIGIFIVATGGYIEFIPKLIAGMKKHFLPNHKRHYFIFTDAGSVKLSGLKKGIDYTLVPTIPREWPYGTMMRYHYYLALMESEKIHRKFDYLYHSDADVELVADLPEEDLFHRMIAVQHCGHIQSTDYETDPKSACYVKPSPKSRYYGGSFNGGEAQKYHNFCWMVTSMLDKDLERGHIPKWHDESAINAYFDVNKPTKVLSPAYHYPKDNPFLKTQLVALGMEADPKIVLIEKGSKEQRDQIIKGKSK